MTRKLLVTVALGAALAIFGAGTATSQIGAQIGAGDLQVDVPTQGGNPQVDVPTQDVLPQCADLSDNDGDGLTDLGDPGCSGPTDGSEYNAPTSSGDTGGSAGGGSGGGTTTTGGGGGGSASYGGSGSGSTGGGKARVEVGQQGGGAKGLFGQQVKKGQGAKDTAKGERQKILQPKLRNPDGTPTDQNPGLTIAPFGPAPIGVPNFVIDSFEIPPFLLPIYQSCGTEYGIPWQVLASINKIETAFGTNLNVSSAGAMGWMQFIPSSWAAYGVDANEDGRKDPYNPVDAICAAARYLRAAGAAEDLRTAIFAYNHADWYVDEVILYASQYGELPEALVGSLTGLTEGAHFPVAADARYADDISDTTAVARSTTKRKGPGNPADVIASDPSRRSINIFSKRGAPVVAVNDGMIKKLGTSKELGKYIVLQDAYGNRYTYAHLGSISKLHPVPKNRSPRPRELEVVSTKADPRPTTPASRTPPPALRRADRAPGKPASSGGPGAFSLGGWLAEVLSESVPGYGVVERYLSRGPSRDYTRYYAPGTEIDLKGTELRPLKVGSRVIGGSVVGRIGGRDGMQRSERGLTSSAQQLNRIARKGEPALPHLNFAIGPAGRGAPTIDPKPILDGWKLLETTAIYRAEGEDPFGADASVGQVLLMSKAALMQRVLADPRLSIYECGRQDIASGQIDRRTLAMLEYLVARGYRLTVTSLKCGHSYLTASGNVSAHSYGAAVDIAAVNGIPVLGNQGPGSITDAVLRDLMLLQGTMRPAQLISLMDLGPPTFALSDHADHIHVGYTFTASGDRLRQLSEILDPEQWERLIERLGELPNPEVRRKPSDAALPAGGRTSQARAGD
jgi:Transglycosylase SLT domain